MIQNRVATILLGGILSLYPVLCISAAAEASPIYKDPAASIKQRVADLISRMSLQDKVNQLHSNDGIQKNFDRGVPKPDGLRSSVGDGLGEVTSLELSVEDEIKIRNAVQKYLVEQTPLGIPVIFHGEACHGLAYNGSGQTSYPVPLGLASSWDEQLYHDVYTEVALEARTRGIQQVLAPVLDIARDPRWGRTDETMGEDGYLNGRLGIATVEAFQGSSDGTIDEQHVAVTLKHFVGHGQPQEGSNTAPANFPPRILLDEHALPFRMVIAAAKPAAVMISYNEIDSVPNHINAWLIQDVLRRQLGFAGLVVSDYSAIKDVCDNQHVARDHADAARKAMNAGMELEFPSEDTFGALPDLIRKGLVKEETINAAVARILSLKFRLGLFEHHILDVNRAKAPPRLQSTKDLALRAAQESIILLKNKNNVLPLDKTRYHTIAVIGPNADACNLGSYSGQPLYTVKLIDGIKEKVGSASQVVYARGCAIDPKRPNDPEDLKRIDEAVEVASKADLIILAIGDKSSICQET
jgi:beta-glucosidase